MKRFSINVLLGVVALAIPAFATPILTFTTSGAASDTGAITKSGTVITGTGIGFLGLGISGATNNNSWTLAGSATGSAASFGFTWDTNLHSGTFSVVGSATRASDGATLTSRTLFSGNITSATVNSESAGSFNFAFNAGTSLQADNGLETFLGVPTNESYTLSGFEIGGSASGYAFNATSSSIAGTGVAATPEPASGLLLGAGFLSLAVMGRRSRSKK